MEAKARNKRYNKQDRIRDAIRHKKQELGRELTEKELNDIGEFFLTEREKKSIAFQAKKIEKEMRGGLSRKEKSIIYQEKKRAIKDKREDVLLYSVGGYQLNNAAIEIANHIKDDPVQDAANMPTGEETIKGILEGYEKWEDLL